MELPRPPRPARGPMPAVSPPAPPMRSGTPALPPAATPALPPVATPATPAAAPTPAAVPAPALAPAPPPTPPAPRPAALEVPAAFAPWPALSPLGARPAEAPPPLGRMSEPESSPQPSNRLALTAKTQTWNFARMLRVARCSTVFSDLTRSSTIRKSPARQFAPDRNRSVSALGLVDLARALRRRAAAHSARPRQ
jgi:hypothetical protein